MNRVEFMKELEGLLQDISKEEREDALMYYQDYFDDAGIENEQTVISELGSPKKVATTILAGLRGSSEAEYTERGYVDTSLEGKEAPAVRSFHDGQQNSTSYEYHTEENDQSSQTQYDYGSQTYQQENQAPRTSNILKVVLIILIAIAACTVAGPVLLGVVGVVFGLVCAAFGIFIGLVVGAAGLMIGGIALVILGLTRMLTAFPIALVTSGAGIIIFVIGLVATVACIKLCMIVFPAMVRGIVSICRIPFHRQGKAVS